MVGLGSGLFFEGCILIRIFLMVGLGSGLYFEGRTRFRVFLDGRSRIRVFFRRLDPATRISNSNNNTPTRDPYLVMGIVNTDLLLRVGSGSSVPPAHLDTTKVITSGGKSDIAAHVEKQVRKRSV